MPVAEVADPVSRRRCAAVHQPSTRVIIRDKEVERCVGRLVVVRWRGTSYPIESEHHCNEKDADERGNREQRSGPHVDSCTGRREQTPPRLILEYSGW